MAFEKELAKAQALDLAQHVRSTYIEIQSLWRILVEKGICTIDEVKSTREYVEKTAPRVRELDNTIRELQGDVDDFQYFMEMMEKKKNGTITDEERRKMKETIDNNPAKYGKFAMEYFKENRSL